MSGKMKNGLELSKQSWSALRKNKQLIAFPLISMVALGIITVLFFIPEALILGPILGANEASSADSDLQWLPFLAVLFVYYLVAYIVLISSNTTLVGATLKLIKGESATVSDGLAIAWSRFGKIFIFALISATVGVIARGISQSGRSSDNVLVAILAAVLGGLIQGACNLLVFFALPVMIVEDLPVRASLKRSFELFKQTWGEGFVGSTAIGGLSCLVYLAVLLVTGGIAAGGIALDIPALIIIGVVLFVLGFAMVGLLNGAVNGVFQASLYDYATTGDSGPFIDNELARQAFG